MTKYYRHYKGGLYEFISEGKHTETGEDMVIYRGEDGRVWVRPREIFYERLDDGTARFQYVADPFAIKWRAIPGWCDVDGVGWQISDCGRLRNTDDPEYIYNDFDEIVDVRFEEITDFKPTHIVLNKVEGEKMVEAAFDFSALKKAVADQQPPFAFARTEYQFG